MPVINDSFMPKADPIDPAVDVYQPRSEIYLFWGVELTPTYEHSFDFFTDVNSQLNFFKNRYDTWVGEEYNYFRERSTIRLPRHYEDVLGVNYLCFKNSNHTNDFYMYGFVTEINYINHDAVELVFEVDVLQTYMFRYELRPSFVERETVKNDGLFQNLVEEHLDTGDRIVAQTEFADLNNMAIVVAYGYKGPDAPVETGGKMINDVFSGLSYKWFEASPAGAEAVNAFVEQFSVAGQMDSIVSIFMLPYAFINGTVPIFTMQRVPGSIDGYVPRNNKLYNYPYHYMTLHNCVADTRVYKPELFSQSVLGFQVKTFYALDSGALAIPTDYAGMDVNYAEGVPLSDFPVCTWFGNVYANWYARNRFSNNIGLATSAITGMIGAVAGGLGGSAAVGASAGLGSISSIINTLGGWMDREAFPYALKGIQSVASGNVHWKRVGFELKRWTIRAEYARRLDGFFSMYGYKVDTVKTPSHKNRLHWDYVKTNGLNVIGRFEQVHVEKLKDIFNKGITFWHDQDIMNYNQSNPTV